jgi:hypothetical protein
LEGGTGGDERGIDEGVRTSQVEKSIAVKVPSFPIAVAPSISEVTPYPSDDNTDFVELQ